MRENLVIIWRLLWTTLRHLRKNDIILSCLGDGPSTPLSWMHRDMHSPLGAAGSPCGVTSLQVGGRAFVPSR